MKDKNENQEKNEPVNLNDYRNLNAWQNGSLINTDPLDNMSLKELKKLAKMVEGVK